MKVAFFLLCLFYVAWSHSFDFGLPNDVDETFDLEQHLDNTGQLDKEEEKEQKEFDVVLRQRRLLESARYKSLRAAYTLKMLLNHMKLNIQTAESLTAGMIVKTLVDVPGEGDTVYGGFVTYDTDAKRKLIQVSTEGVYSEKTAKQMAEGALENSRAMVALAVTGDSMPSPDAENRLGQVYIGVALRTLPRQTFTMTLRVCDEDVTTNLCNAWKTLTVPQSAKQKIAKYAPFQFTSMVSDYVRLRTVWIACEFAIAKLKKVEFLVDWDTLPFEPWDMECRPSTILYDRLSGKKDDHVCNETSTRDIKLDFK